MTPVEMIEARMVALWGKRNVTRLSKESGVARESVSKILGGARGIGADVAPKLAAPLGLEPQELLRPQVEPANLATVLRRLEEARAADERERKGLARALRKIHTDLRRIEARLPAEAERVREAR